MWAGRWFQRIFDLWIYAKHFPYSISYKTHNHLVRYAVSLPFYQWRNWGSEKANSLLKFLQPSKWQNQDVAPSLPDSPHVLCLQAACESVRAGFTHVLLITLILWISLKKPLCLASRPLPAPLSLQNVIPPHIWSSVWLKNVVFLYPAFTGRTDTLAFQISHLHSPVSSSGHLFAAYMH